MAKRFTCTDKWKKIWFRKLMPIHKCFWFYICDNCNHAGIWEVDFESAEWFIGSTLNMDEVCKVFKKQYHEINHGKAWLISDFIDFQYGILNPANRVHSSVIKSLQKEGASKGLLRSLQGAKDKDKDKDKVKDKEKDYCNFESLWKKYPRQLGKKSAEKHFISSVKTDNDLQDINKALGNYLLSVKGVDIKYIKHGSAWFNNWRDYINYKETFIKNSSPHIKLFNRSDIICEELKEPEKRNPQELKKVRKLIQGVVNKIENKT